MDPADAWQALTTQGTLLRQPEQLIHIVLHNVAAFSQSMHDLSRHMASEAASMHESLSDLSLEDFF